MYTAAPHDNTAEMNSFAYKKNIETYERQLLMWLVQQKPAWFTGCLLSLKMWENKSRYEKEKHVHAKKGMILSKQSAFWSIFRVKHTELLVSTSSWSWAGIAAKLRPATRSASRPYRCFSCTRAGAAERIPTGPGSRKDQRKEWNPSDR